MELGNSKQSYNKNNFKLYQLQQMVRQQQNHANQGLQNAYQNAYHQNALSNQIDNSNEILLLIEEGV